MKNKHWRHRRLPIGRLPIRPGVTLLELLLALALSSLILGAVAMAINLNMRAVDTRRTDVEEAQLARAIMQNIANDLRSSIQYEEVDYSKFEEMAKNAVSALSQGQGGQNGQGQNDRNNQGGDNQGDDNQGDDNQGDDNQGGDNQRGNNQAGENQGGDNPSGGGNTSSNTQGGGASGQDANFTQGDSLSDTETEETTTELQSVATSVVTQSKPGLYGSQFELQVDVSRLPRVDQYNPANIPTEDATPTRFPSDVKTVAYYLKGDPLGLNSDTATSGAPAPSTSQEAADDTAAVGLVRRTLDRAVSLYAANNLGGVQSPEQYERLMAPEVTYLEFAYYDGLDWLTDWDSEQQGGLPKAVKITLGIRSSRQRASGAEGNTSSNSSTASIDPAALAAEGQLLYQQIVYLPASEKPQSTDAAAMNGAGVMGDSSQPSTGQASGSGGSNTDGGNSGTNMGNNMGNTGQGR